MKIAFTICTNNYLSRAFALKESYLQYHPTSEFLIILIDKVISLEGIIPASLTNGIIEIKEIEPEVAALSAKFDIVELSTAVKPAIFLWLFNNRPDATAFIYLDPDLFFYNSLDFIEDFDKSYSVFLTPHILRPIPIDDLQPNESLFLKYGVYNLGFLYVRNNLEVLPFLEWWKKRTYLMGYNNLSKGLFVDQLFINLAPVLFEFFFILRHFGLNVAPWNFQDRIISTNKDEYIVNENDPLVFMHFSDFSPERPDQISNRNWYSRNIMVKGSELSALYITYAKKLNSMWHLKLSSLNSVYYNQKKKAGLLSKIRGIYKKFK